jgi:hypothetical protein
MLTRTSRGLSRQEVRLSCASVRFLESTVPSVQAVRVSCCGRRTSSIRLIRRYPPSVHRQLVRQVAPMQDGLQKLRRFASAADSESDDALALECARIFPRGSRLCTLTKGLLDLRCMRPTLSAARCARLVHDCGWPSAHSEPLRDWAPPTRARARTRTHAAH